MFAACGCESNDGYKNSYKDLSANLKRNQKLRNQIIRNELSAKVIVPHLGLGFGLGLGLGLGSRLYYLIQG